MKPSFNLYSDSPFRKREYNIEPHLGLTALGQKYCWTDKCKKDECYAE